MDRRRKNFSDRPTVYVVHCIDTEGPLHESLKATFERLHSIFHLELKPSRETLQKLQTGKIKLGGLEEAVKQTLDPHLLNYNNTWQKLDLMLKDALCPEFRNEVRDSAGKGWIFNWFCVDHVDYEVNPRRRDMGYHNIFNHYSDILDETGARQDGLHFHYHPHAFLKQAHVCATHWWASSNSLYQVLSRRIIDRHWFPACNRPGFQVNRPDSHWFLEQFIPFDYSSLAIETTKTDEQQFDFSAGRSGDWRRAPRTWAPYHPSHDDYQLPGECRRWIARCLNIGTRSYNINEREVRRAFEEAMEDKPVVLSFSDHDYRDLRVDVRQGRDLIQKVGRQYPKVKYLYCEAIDALRKALNLPSMKHCELKLEMKKQGDAHVLRVRSSAPIFGPQPYLALKTVTDQYFHDNFDMQVPFREWTYTFDRETFPLRAVETVGVAANNAYGVTTVATLDAATEKTTTTYWNEPAR